MPRLVRLKVPPGTPSGAASFWRPRAASSRHLASQRAQRLSDPRIAHDGVIRPLAFVERHGDADIDAVVLDGCCPSRASDMLADGTTRSARAKCLEHHVIDADFFATRARFGLAVRGTATAHRRRHRWSDRSAARSAWLPPGAARRCGGSSAARPARRRPASLCGGWALAAGRNHRDLGGGARCGSLCRHQGGRRVRARCRA